jgi:hypothetical protein
LGLERGILKTSAERAAEAGVVNQIRIPWMVSAIDQRNPILMSR